MIHFEKSIHEFQDKINKYNAADQLTSDGTHSYGYDYNGNLTTIDSTSTYTYTYTNLLSAKVGGTSMLWDASENRVRFTSSTDQSYPYYFVYDTTAGIPAVIEEVHDGSSVFYVREPYGALICRIDGETTNYYGFDELGNTLFLTASNGTVSDKYTYDAWGNVTSHTGSTSQPYQYIGRLGYYTHWQDSNMGDLLQLGVRYYEPETGRFTQRDPITYDREASYLYASLRPIYLVDPSGYAASIWKCTNDKPPKICRKWPAKAWFIYYWCYGCLNSCVMMCEDIYKGDAKKMDRCWVYCGKGSSKKYPTGGFSNCLTSNFEFKIVQP